MSQPLPEELFIKDTRVNAALSWLLTTVLVVVAVVSFVEVLFVAMAFAAVAAFVAVVPAVVHRSWTTTVPWPLLLLISLPIALGTFRLAFFDDLVTGLSISALAMLVVIALQLISSVRMTPAFAVFFTLIATLSTAGFWAVGSAVSASNWGTSFVESNEELMAIFSATAIAGLVAAAVFRWYFRHELDRNVERPEERTMP